MLHILLGECPVKRADMVNYQICRPVILRLPELVRILGEERSSEGVIEHLHAGVCSPSRIGRFLSLKPSGLHPEVRVPGR